MFIGEYRPLLDDRGRVAVPVKIRKAYGPDMIDRLVMAPGFDRCVMAFRPQDWENFVKEKLLSLPQNDPENRKRIRFLLGGASDCDLDKQGRILIPPALADFAGLVKDTVIIGVYDRIEIWSAERYDGYRPSMDRFDEFASDLGV
ncbi:MAG: division/cell wall cluster transcriptional repressor MraZ [Spirochaetes bacterium]|nr:division/cell wall cluster transcriptional repressor MraZ [Spirochaetota bacterium]MBN2772168.1 division/cell wall cluster transcriptional repressor MraZ [Spirochaetota bacterium]